MNAAHLIPTAHWNLSTPLTARALLRLFAITLVAGVCVGAYSYLRLALDQDISLHRRYMNEAVFDAQSFFVSRQTLLKSLGLSTVRHRDATQAVIGDIPEEEVHLRLGNGREIWSLWLTRRVLDHLSASQVNLIYVPHTRGGQVQRLFSSVSAGETTPLADLAPGIVQRIRDADDDPARNELWLTAAGRLDSPLYLFIRLDERDLASGWLGIEVEGPDLIKALQHKQAGDFKLLDGSGQLIVSNALQHHAPARSLSEQHRTHSFGWEGGQWLPERLTIRKPLDYAGWQIVYSLQLRSLLPALAMPAALALLSCLLTILSMLWLVRRIEQRLIAPAAARIDALVESEAFSSAVIRIAPVALCVLRRTDGAMVLENPLSERWLGQGDERARLCRDWVDRAFGLASSKSTAEEQQMADGRHLYLSYAATRYRGEEVLICAFSDITERKSIELALQQARTLADAANEAKTLFLATMSHEIRTPLYGVLATLELLGRTQLDDRQRGYLDAIEGSSATLLQLICDVLEVSKIEAGQLALELSAFSPLELTEDLLQSCAGAAQTKGLQLLGFLDPEVPVQVMGDATRTRQVLGNLLSNAVKFTAKGRIVVRLDLIEQGQRQLLRWQVVDTGQGIPAADQAHLFEPFFQSGNRTNLVAGTGLGLSICKRLVDLMDGALRVFSEPGLGSSFAFTLPLEAIAEHPQHAWVEPLLDEWVYVECVNVQVAEHAAAWLRHWGARVQVGVPDMTQVPSDAVLVELCIDASSRVVWPQWPGTCVLVCADSHGMLRVTPRRWHVGLNSLRGLNQAVSQAQGTPPAVSTGAPASLHEPSLHLRVLVAEDNVINQLILRDQLEELGCRVVLARDGVEAIARWQEAPFDIVITDVNMPRINGYELTEQLRQLGCRVPIIGATANAMLDEAERCLGAGMDRFLVKPFTLHALYQCLQTSQGSAP
ncbi:response regulator [Pseudomonas sp. S75]|uniref:ATP-binding protein n=1 Tax=unclassified Pseudomonas TaxID=196821 RepID=UPI0019050850|nr:MULTISPECIES: ATP-binding protein [unclassified Pseudomonas]MBJ9977669.1 response regulator [Pseudomonas sp. S30]MBK0155041.1 response regulator [Pseudomonas sp. S75]